MTSLTSNKYNNKCSGSFLFSARVTVVSDLEKQHLWPVMTAGHVSFNPLNKLSVERSKFLRVYRWLFSVAAQPGYC